MENKKIGKYLFNKRKEEGKTQKEIADELGVTYQAVSRWENGDSIPDIETLCMIADLYHVTVDEILQREATEQEEEKSEMILLAFMSVTVYIIAIIVFLVINAVWLREVAIGAFAFLGISGMVPANIYFFGESKKTKNDILIYLLSYLPLLIGVILVLFIK